MFKIVKHPTFLKCVSLEKNKLFRQFMSETFNCKDAWNSRLNNNIIKKVKFNDMYLELDKKFSHIGKVSAVDVDIFANSAIENVQLEDVEDIVHRFRLTSEASNIFDSTHHAFIRAFLSFGEHDDLMRILNDRLNYGIFPDDYCNILMMDHFIKENNYKNAAKVATIQMLQEDFNNPLIKYFSLFSCLKYLHEPVVWDKVDEVVQKVEVTRDGNDEEEEEEIKVRVKYLRNPYFDDHFDLTDPYCLIGKTFKIIGQNNNDSLSSSYQLLGHVLHKKWQDGINFSNNLLAKNEQINVGCVEEIEKFLSTLPLEENEKGNEIKEEIEKIKNNVQKLQTNNLISDKDLLSSTEEKLMSTVKEMESQIIQSQCQLYENWEAKREEYLMKQLEELQRLKRLENVKLKKEEMARKEQELFFFDLEDKLDLKIEEMKSRDNWSKQIKSKKTDDSDYIPPEIQKKYN